MVGTGYDFRHLTVNFPFLLPFKSPFGRKWYTDTYRVKPGCSTWQTLAHSRKFTSRSRVSFSVLRDVTCSFRCLCFSTVTCLRLISSMFSVRDLEGTKSFVIECMRTTEQITKFHLLSDVTAMGNASFTVSVRSYFLIVSIEISRP